MDVSKNIYPGLQREEIFEVKEIHSAQHLGSGDVHVLATPMLILFMEQNARRLLGEHLPVGYSSVGVHVDVHHLAPTPVGSDVRAKALVENMEGNKVTFVVDLWDSKEKVGVGKHTRVIIDEARFMRRVHAKT